MRVKFTGRDSLGYRHGQTYDLDVKTNWLGRPIIRRPYPCPYSSWDTFWANWEKVPEVRA